MVNEQIRDKEVRLIDVDGTQLGVVNAKEAQRMANERNLDLVKIVPNANPPVCKIIDYGKYKFEQTKREKEAKKKQKVINVKEVRLSPNIGEHDLNTKIKQAEKFLKNGDKVKVTIRFRGREMAHTQVGKEILDEIAKTLSEVGTIDKPAKMEGRNMVMYLMSK
ncbi:MAG: translation initiation factor IF-3 [Epulopiscium sp.]|nr:translation initiation factor IF-3 [Candidatus Epulonipiscium sp.]